MRTQSGRVKQLSQEYEGGSARSPARQQVYMVTPPPLQSTALESAENPCNLACNVEGAVDDGSLGLPRSCSADALTAPNSSSLDTSAAMDEDVPEFFEGGDWRITGALEQSSSSSSYKCRICLDVTNLCSHWWDVGRHSRPY